MSISHKELSKIEEKYQHATTGARDESAVEALVSEIPRLIDTIKQLQSKIDTNFEKTIKPLVKDYFKQYVEMILLDFVVYARANGLQITDIVSTEDDDAIYKVIQNYIKESLNK